MADPAPQSSGGSSAKHWALGIAALLGVIFIALNSQKVEVDFLVGKSELPLVFALLITGVLGFVIGWVGARLRDRRHH